MGTAGRRRVLATLTYMPSVVVLLENWGALFVGRIIETGDNSPSMASSGIDFTGMIAVLPLGTMGNMAQGVVRDGAMCLSCRPFPTQHTHACGVDGQEPRTMTHHHHHSTMTHLPPLILSHVGCRRSRTTARARQRSRMHPRPALQAKVCSVTAARHFQNSYVFCSKSNTTLKLRVHPQ